MSALAAPPPPRATPAGSIRPISAEVPRELLSRSRFLADAGRSMGLLVIATRGTGKSRLLGRIVTFQDLLRGVATIVIDPLGGTIDNLLDQLSRLPQETQQRLWPRIRYVNMAGQAGRVLPFPIYYRATPTDSLYAISQRYVDLLRRADPALLTASIQGWNRLAPLCTATGMVLSALDLGITEAESLIITPDAWMDRLAHARQRHPDAAPAVDYFAEFSALPQREREMRAEGLRNKLSLFRFDPTARALFGATTPALGWDEVVANRQCVLMDFRDLTDLSRMQFALLWVFGSLLAYAKRRSNDKAQPPFSLVIDELSYLVGGGSPNTEVLTADLEELINRLARNKNIWVTLAAQEQYQLPESIRNTLLSMGNQIFGSTSDLEAAIRLARRYLRYRPYWVKKRVPVYQMGGVVDYTTEEFTKDEQEYLNALRFLDLPRFHFLVAGSLREGTLPTRLQRISIARLDQGQYVNVPLVAHARALLMERYGRPISVVLSEIDNRTRTNILINQTEPHTMKAYDDNDLPPYHEEKDYDENDSDSTPSF